MSKGYKTKNKKISLSLTIVIVCTLIYLFIQLVGGCVQKSQNKTEPQEDSSEAGLCEITAIDVGQGDAILITTPDGNVLFDAGPGKGEDQLQSYLDSHKIDSFEYVIFSHPDEDHIGGGDMIMKRYSVKNVIMPDTTSNSTAFEKLLKAIDKSDANVIMAKADNTYSIGQLELKILSPISDDYSDSNKFSVVCKATYQSFTMLLTGDAEKQNEREMIERWGRELSCDVLKVAHHGSSSSSSEDFLDIANPRIALISLGLGNSYGHPHVETVEALEERGITMLRTDEMGSVTVASDGTNYWIKK